MPITEERVEQGRAILKRYLDEASEVEDMLHEDNAFVLGVAGALDLLDELLAKGVPLEKAINTELCMEARKLELPYFRDVQKVELLHPCEDSGKRWRTPKSDNVRLSDNWQALGLLVARKVLQKGLQPRAKKDGAE